ncbi:hypothetical protein FN846DRAFT_339246 [Sphaerosporella brunnea]|uniref:Uncharacterized protein n=1 Tax=Sphaerosporella brunnea TaxID=1250544 RepID=A0A5J5EIE2_9PEZI|nr:hypothetical protein FN846DRAFT_339246 [Sphaerosporella brunnea]
MAWKEKSASDRIRRKREERRAFAPTLWESEAKPPEIEAAPASRSLEGQSMLVCAKSSRLIDIAKDHRQRNTSIHSEDAHNSPRRISSFRKRAHARTSQMLRGLFITPKILAPDAHQNSGHRRSDNVCHSITHSSNPHCLPPTLQFIIQHPTAPKRASNEPQPIIRPRPVCTISSTSRTISPVSVSRACGVWRRVGVVAIVDCLSRIP